ncbi:MAG: hypothetical protein M3458_01200 [Acidobacteriota bacterium]|nr:hypothetical protein [Acidobacteriota bacterium]
MAQITRRRKSKRGTAYDKASVSVTTGTRLFKGRRRRTATFDDLRVGIHGEAHGE